MIEEAIISVPMPEMVEGKGFRISSMISDLEKSFHKLTPSEQSEVLSLHDYSDPTEQKQSKLMAIFRSNAFNTGDDRIGLFPKIARINHSCLPNAGYHWSTKKNHRVVYATTDIENGDEITVSYIPLLKTTKQRQARLQAYGFTCDCEACQQQDGGKKRVEISDHLVSLRAKLEWPNKQRSAKATEKIVAKAIALVEMIQDEGLTEYLAEANHITAVLLQQCGNLGHARVFAQNEYMLKTWADADSDEAKESAEYIQELMEEQRRHNAAS